ncbi:MFS transporter [Saccharothrix coeruleofusca]|uniref:Major facilitator superfamily (MFS) profile domain-containing protein n=1 Tax=Saccharothrix coeruleofusca TaxID=33919 RepID=A0A918AYE2_9PSEU|nr:MFS transporter [Saccharothrix coeruleofusca]MBP2334877.1 putative MFS family arabinose efflux permease [Saccharothrix coeruleofusca]GGP88064.1 hypothetical protein GCM10010185_71960 [Saccharothrix coeruleofusca]
MTTSATSPFVRSRTTVLGYLTIAVFGYCLYALGPVLAVVQRNFGISYFLMSAHSSFWAVGTVVAGLTFARLARVLGRTRLLRLCFVATASGAALFAVGNHVAVTLTASALLGTAGSLLQTCTFAVLSDHHGSRRDRALVEANIGASAAAVLAPLALGGLAAGPLGWRAVMALPVLALIVLGLVFRRVEPPRSATPTPGTGSADGRMSTRTWLLCALVGIVVGVEFCLVFYGAQLLHSTTGVDTVWAATAMALFFAAELLGRVVGSGLTRRPGRSRRLLAGTLVLSIAGMLLLWLSRDPVVALVGLMAAGLGIANLFPLALTLALASAQGLTDRAAARSQFFVGTAIALGPLVLGLLSDRWGVQRGFLTALLLAAVALALLFTGGSDGFPRRRRKVDVKQPE